MDGLQRCRRRRATGHGFTISSPCEPEGSDELEMGGSGVATNRLAKIAFDDKAILIDIQNICFYGEPTVKAKHCYYL